MRSVHRDEGRVEIEWPPKGGCEWVDSKLKMHTFKFRFSSMLTSWLNNIYMFEGDEVEDIVTFESEIDNIFHG